ncbi:MAG: murein biosynthesis integral membrane protein MurJ [Burkholderiales bacterium]|nr:murein biosynthesis integral membrane protein MurJ [Burkholderiales bacterium]OUT77622.1 MAG: murein biosynthesis integral membrane protein MurJ [Betaproteobacteria bacterium TMED22]|tara:strand:+ start:27258 stop:28799 length:1542 start_codon:yes stop_codon:yes gene_type:complete
MGLFKSLSVVSFFTLLSRLLGLVREMVIAAKFGAGASTDALFVAFRIPNLLRRLFAEGAFAQAFVPILAEYREREGNERAKLLIAHVASLLSLLLLIISIIGVLCAPYLVYVIATGFKESPGQAELTTNLIRLTFPYLLFISLTSLFSSVLNTWGRFAVPAFTPALLNISFILSSLYLTPYFDPPIMALGLAILLGGIAQLAFQIPFLLQLKLWPKLKWRPNDPGVIQVLKKMAPAVIGVSAAQISLLINTNIASRMQTGSVSWLTFADRLMELPVGLLGVAMGTVILPALSVSVANKQDGEYQATLEWGLILMLVISIPSVCGLIALSEPILITLFLRDQFSLTDVSMTQVAFWGYGVGLVPIVMIKLFAPVFYANKDTQTPVRIAIKAIIVTQLLNVIFWMLLPEHIKHAGLALAISGGAWLNAILLVAGLRRDGLFVLTNKWILVCRDSIIAAAIMTLIVSFVSVKIDWIASDSWERAGLLLVVILLGFTVYTVALKFLGRRLKDILALG